MTGNAENDQRYDQEPARHRRDKGLQRRRILIGGGTVALAGGLAAAGFASADTPSATTVTSDASASATSGVCTLTAEVTEGRTRSTAP